MFIKALVIKAFYDGVDPLGILLISTSDMRSCWGMLAETDMPLAMISFAQKSGAGTR